MIRVPEAIALQIEASAERTLEMHGETWRSVSADYLKQRRTLVLERLVLWNNLKIETVDPTTLKSIRQHLTELAVIGHILREKEPLIYPEGKPTLKVIT